MSSDWQLLEEMERPPAPPKPLSPEDQAAREARRLQKRGEIKRRIAQAKIAEVRHGEASEALSRVDLEKDQLAAEHVQACQTLQARLREIEQHQVDQAVENGPADPALAEERTRLADELRQRNAALETAIAEKNRIADALYRERREAGMASADLTLSSDLVFELGRPDLLRVLCVAQDRVKWADSRMRSTVEKAERFPGTLADALVSDARAELARAQSMVTEAHRRVVEE
jgi:hypothetical protein